MLKNDDTIVAIATPSGYGAIAVIRISGNNSMKIIKKIFCSFSKKQIEKKYIHLGYIKYKKKFLIKS